MVLRTIVMLSATGAIRTPFTEPICKKEGTKIGLLLSIE